MTELTDYLGLKITPSEKDVVEAIRKKTGERSASDVIRKAIAHYAKYNGVGDHE